MFVEYSWSLVCGRTRAFFVGIVMGMNTFGCVLSMSATLVVIRMTAVFKFDSFVGGWILASNNDARASNKKAARKASRDIHYTWICDDI